MTDKVVVLSTCGSMEEAERIARTLIEQHLAACVNVLPGVRSFYRWKGEIESAAEHLLVIKTTRDVFPSLTAALERLHSYETPEVLALPVVDGAANYLNWIDAELPKE